MTLREQYELETGGVISMEFKHPETGAPCNGFSGEYVQWLEQRLESASAVDTIVSSAEWISVEDRVPPDGAYLCCNLDGWIRVCYRFPSLEDYNWKTLGGDEIVNPSHWRPLPEPPKS